MNLGLVVLSADNEVFFQTSLVTSEALSTRFTLPAEEQPTSGVFHISLIEQTIPAASSRFYSSIDALINFAFRLRLGMIKITVSVPTKRDGWSVCAWRCQPNKRPSFTARAFWW